MLDPLDSANGSVIERCWAGQVPGSVGYGKWLASRDLSVVERMTGILNETRRPGIA